MISTPDRQQAVTLIAVARTEGARLEPACAVVGITVRTHQRWTREGGVREDQRPLADRATPSNALCAEETQAILEACHRPEHASLPPDQIVVRLLDQEALYLGSVSTFYRVLRRHGEVTHRGRAKTPKRQARPTTYHAIAPNQLWSWDCSWLPGPVKGTYYYLVMIIDIFSRKVVAWEVFLGESADNARSVLERAVLAEHVVQQRWCCMPITGVPSRRRRCWKNSAT
jgi:putative transposase